MLFSVKFSACNEVLQENVNKYLISCQKFIWGGGVHESPVLTNSLT